MGGLAAVTGRKGITVDDVVFNLDPVALPEVQEQALVRELSEGSAKVSSILASAKGLDFQTSALFFPRDKAPSVYLVGVHHGNHFENPANSNASTATATMLESVAQLIQRVHGNGLMASPSIVGVEWLIHGEEAQKLHGAVSSRAWNRLLDTATSGFYSSQNVGTVHIEGNVNMVLIYQMGTATDERSPDEIARDPFTRHLSKGERDVQARVGYALQLVQKHIVPHIEEVLARKPQVKTFFYVMGSALLHPTQMLLEQRDRPIPYASVFMK